MYALQADVLSVPWWCGRLGSHISPLNRQNPAQVSIKHQQETQRKSQETPQNTPTYYIAKEDQKDPRSNAVHRFKLFLFFRPIPRPPSLQPPWPRRRPSPRLWPFGHGSKKGELFSPPSETSSTADCVISFLFTNKVFGTLFWVGWETIGSTVFGKIFPFTKQPCTKQAFFHT